jgi:hypothetical protein
MRIATLTIILFVAAIARAQTAPATRPAVARAALEKEFEATMTGAVLVGHSSDTRKPDAPPRSERYTIDRVSKVPGSENRWLFNARIPFRGAEMSVPLIVPIEWAGDTPVISLTDLTIPGMGTYTARVMIYRGQYAGTWSCIDHGGEMWGRIERAGASTKPAAP